MVCYSIQFFFFFSRVTLHCRYCMYCCLGASSLLRLVSFFNQWNQNKKKKVKQAKNNTHTHTKHKGNKIIKEKKQNRIHTITFSIPFYCFLLSKDKKKMRLHCFCLFFLRISSFFFSLLVGRCVYPFAYSFSLLCRSKFEYKKQRKKKQK